MKLTQSELILYAAIAGAVIGLVFGGIVLLLAIRKGKRNLGIIGFVVCLLAGPISGVISIVVAGVFVWLIYRKPADAGADDNSPGNAPEDE